MNLNLNRLGWMICSLLLLTALLGCEPADAPGDPTLTSSGGSGEETAPAEIVTIEGLEGLSGTVTIDGSSTVYPVTEAVAEEFQIATNQGVKVTVGISGTGGGFKKFGRGEIDISDASRPIKPEEPQDAANNGIDFVELPVCFDALTVVVNPENDWVESITIDELKKMWEPAAEGKIMKWSDVNPAWPNEDLVLYGPGTDSGTFDYFTEAIVGTAKDSRGDFTPSEDDNTLVQGVETNKNALGYFGFAYFAENKDKLKALKIVPEGETEGVEPNAENVLAGKYTPLSRPLFIYLSTKAVERPEVKKFAEFYLTNVPALAAEVKYVPLPDADMSKVRERFQAMKTGSAFADESATGKTLSEILSLK